MLQFITLLSVGGSSVVGGWLVGWLVVGGIKQLTLLIFILWLNDDFMVVSGTMNS